MYQQQTGAVEPLADYLIDPNPMRYSQFVPRLYGLCLGLGMEQGRIMPSRAFCSDESQGYPVILLAKHFGAFPFNHGQVGGIVATDRHGPHAHHGQDLVIVQASHVGYDAETGTFGVYRRLQSADHECTTSCGKICGVLDWYQGEYRFAQDHILIAEAELGPVVIVDNLLVRQDRDQGLMLHMPRLVRFDAEGHPSYVRSLSTAKVFHMAEGLADRLAGRIPATPTPIGEGLTPDLFYFRRRDRERRGGARPPGAQSDSVHAPDRHRPGPGPDRGQDQHPDRVRPHLPHPGARSPPTAASGCSSSPGSTWTCRPPRGASSR